MADDGDGPLLGTVDRPRQLTQRAMPRTDILRMIKRLARAADLPPSTCCHTFRAADVTSYSSGAGSIEHAQAIVGRESSRTARLRDRASEAITLDEAERILT